MALQLGGFYAFHFNLEIHTLKTLINTITTASSMRVQAIQVHLMPSIL